ncbi:hypothetical protein BN8_01023 [Fibrisoma limi BUZ 3]|uniref:DUF4157 domain-containing protein n=2 Tax=Fibrisoma limi TaxID=663275 RepID=I2GDS6_9BACT|nr:hypothetical protein BN8_01023 [Fibrisoma limi BUZ 3]
MANGHYNLGKPYFRMAKLSKKLIITVPFLGPDGMALFPFILVRRPDPGPTLLNHERIHLRQQLELGIVPFYLWYGIEYLIRRWQYRDHYTAYRNISFEREAFSNERDLQYLTTRTWFAFSQYLRTTQKA